MTALLGPRRDQMLWQVMCVQRSRKACGGASKDNKYDEEGDSSMGRCVGKMSLMVEVDGVDVVKVGRGVEGERNLLLCEGSLKSFGRS
jgi:hypothetical protein